MTLQEAIEHAEKTAKTCEGASLRCAELHRQLAAWLRELQLRRDKEAKLGRKNTSSWGKRA